MSGPQYILIPTAAHCLENSLVKVFAANSQETACIAHKAVLLLSVMPHSLVFSCTCHQALGRHVLIQVQQWRPVLWLQLSYSLCALLRKVVRLNQSCRACKHGPCFSKIQCMVQLSSDQTPGVTGIITTSAVRCFVSAYGDPKDWSTGCIYLQRVVFVIISVVTGKKKPV